MSVSWLSHGTARFIEIFGFLTAADLQKVVVDLHISRIWHTPFLAVQDTSITDIVCPSVGLSEPTNNQSLGRLLRDCSDTTVTLQ